MVLLISIFIHYFAGRNDKKGLQMIDILSYKRLRPKGSSTDKRRGFGDYKHDHRSPIESDLGRVVFSPASRRLHDKTQVFPLITDDNTHSRLTHSMEVQSIGYTFAIFLSQSQVFCDKIGKQKGDVELFRDLYAVLSTICLTHDIGNPPFGHFGEVSIQQYFKALFTEMGKDIRTFEKEHCCHSVLMKHLIEEVGEDEGRERLQQVRDFLDNSNLLLDYTDFDGNAEGFRVLTKLQYLNDLYGMNLTSASLASYLKYPNCSSIDKSCISQKKHGVFTTEKERMQSVLNNCGMSDKNDNSFNRHPLSFLMEAADTISYLCMDMEDAFSKGWVGFDDIIQLYKVEENDAWRKIVDNANSHYETDDPDEKKIVQLRTEIIEYLVLLACENFENNIDKIFEGEYDEELVTDDKNKIAKALNDFCINRIFRHREIESLEITGNAVVKGIMDTYVDLLFHPDKGFRKRGKDLISKTIVMTTLQEHYEEKKSCKIAHVEYKDFDIGDLTIEERLRIIRDFVAGMTDSYALNHYRKLSGQRI